MDYSTCLVLLIIIIVAYYIFRKKKPIPQVLSVDNRSIEELYPNLSDNEIMSILYEKDQMEMTDSEFDFFLGMSTYSESIHGEFSALQPLLDNHYIVLEEESGNPHKEVINFVLKYFEKNLEERYSELTSAFPIMHVYINRYLLKEESDIEIKEPFCQEKAYKEFLYFCRNYFLTIYPNKTERDSQIHLHFKNMGYGLIEFFERQTE